MSTAIKSRSKKYVIFERTLQAMQDELRSRVNARLGDVFVENEPDDEVALANHSLAKDLAVATLERERRTLKEIQDALGRMKTGDYGECGMCGSPIPDARLRALPWARLCVQCADRASSGAMAAD